MVLTLTPVTRISFLQFSAVSCVQRCPSTHQSQGNDEFTHWVHELYVLQSKNVKFVATKSGPLAIRTESFAVKWSTTKKYKKNNVIANTLIQWCNQRVLKNIYFLYFLGPSIAHVLVFSLICVTDKTYIFLLILLS